MAVFKPGFLTFITETFFDLAHAATSSSSQTTQIDKEPDESITVSAIFFIRTERSDLLRLSESLALASWKDLIGIKTAVVLFIRWSL